MATPRGFASQLRTGKPPAAAEAPVDSESSEAPGQPDETEGAGPPEDAADTGGQGPAGQQQDLTPQDKQQLHQAMDIATQLLYQDPKTGSAVAAILQKAAGSNMVPQAVGDIVASLVREADRRMKDQLDGSLVMPLGVMLMDRVLNIGEELRFFKADQALLEASMKAVNTALARFYGGGQAPAQPGTAQPPGAAAQPSPQMPPASPPQPTAGAAPTGAPANV